MTPEEAISLRQYIEALLVSHEQRASDRFAALRELIEQRIAVEVKRSEDDREALHAELARHAQAVGEEIAALHERTERAMSVEDYDRRHDELEKRVALIEVWRANLSGRAIGLTMIGAVLVAVVSAIITHLVTGG